MHTQFEQENQRGRDHLEDLGMGGIIILELGIKSITNNVKTSGHIEKKSKINNCKLFRD
jgi:hypothetical protein